MKKFGEGLTSNQIALARRIESAGITTYSQVVKALQRKEKIVDEWIKKLNENK